MVNVSSNAEMALGNIAHRCDGGTPVSITLNNGGTVGFYDGATLLATVPVNVGGLANDATTSSRAGSQTIIATWAGGANCASGLSSATIPLVQQGFALGSNRSSVPLDHGDADTRGRALG